MRGSVRFRRQMPHYWSPKTARALVYGWPVTNPQPTSSNIPQSRLDIRTATLVCDTTRWFTPVGFLLSNFPLLPQRDGIKNS